jgi:hypothetical protein
MASHLSDFMKGLQALSTVFCPTMIYDTLETGLVSIAHRFSAVPHLVESLIVFSDFSGEKSTHTNRYAGSIPDTTHVVKFHHDIPPRWCCVVERLSNATLTECTNYSLHRKKITLSARVEAYAIRTRACDNAKGSFINHLLSTYTFTPLSTPRLGTLSDRSTPGIFCSRLPYIERH